MTAHNLSFEKFWYIIVCTLAYADTELQSLLLFSFFSMCTLVVKPTGIVCQSVHIHELMCVPLVRLDTGHLHQQNGGG